MTTPEATARRPGQPARAAAIAAAVALLAVLALLPALDCGFVAYDDPQGRPEYAPVLRGLERGSVSWAFRETFFGHWLPLTVLSHMLDWELYGADPRGHHLTSVLLHAAGAAAVFLLWRSTTGQPWRAAVVASLWAVHPLRVEPVVWIASRKDVLSSLLSLLALLLYVAWTRRPTAGRYAMVAGALALALLSKAMAMTLPVVMLLLDFWPLERLRPPAEGSLRRRMAAFGRAAWPLALEKLPLLALAAAAGAVAYLSQLRGGAMADLAALPLAQRLAIAALSIPRYLASQLWPAGLVPFYPLPAAEPPWGAALAAAALVVAVTAFALARTGRWPWLAVGWLWFLVTLVPVSGLTQAGEQSHADRYTHLASVGLLVAVVWGVGEALARRPAWRLAGAATAVALVAAWSVATRAQIAHWHSSEALFTHTLAVDPDNPMAHLNLGVLRAGQGRLDEAIAHARRAAELRPALAGAHNNLGTALAARGDHAGARAAFETAIRRDPALVSAHFNLAVLLADAGAAGPAVGHLARVVSLQPEYAPAWRGLDALLARPGVAAEAAPFLAALRREDPASSELRRVEAMVRRAGASAAASGTVQ